MTDSSTLAKAINRYLLFLRSEENKSPLTVESYTRSLKLFLEMCGVNTPEEINKTTIRIFKSELHSYRTRQGHEIAVRTKNHHLTIVRAFLRYLLAEEEMNTYPPDRVTRFKEENRKVKVLFTDELQRLLNEPDINTREGIRDSAMLQLFFFNGATSCRTSIAKY